MEQPNHQCFVTSLKEEGEVQHNLESLQQQNSNNTQIMDIAVQTQQPQREEVQIKVKQFPSFREIQESIAILRSAVPPLFHSQFIKYLNHQIQQAIGSSQIRSDSPVLTSHLSPLIQKQSIMTQLPHEPQHAIEKMAQVKQQPQFQQPIKDQNFDKVTQIGSIIVQTFCCQGLNIDKFKRQLYRQGLGSSINSINYTQFIKNIIIKTYSKIQEFIKIEVQPNINVLSSEYGLDSITDILLTYKDHLSQISCATFTSIIRAQCGLNGPKVDSANILKLIEELSNKVKQILKSKHTSVLPTTHQNLSITQKLYSHQALAASTVGHFYREPRSLKSRRRSSKSTLLDKINALNQVWNVRYELQLIRLYRNNNSMAQICQILKKQFPRDKVYFSVGALRSIIFKILRQAVKKLFEFVFNQGSMHLPPIKKISYIEVRHLIHNIGSVKVRFLLFDIYLSKQYDLRLVMKTLEEIDLYLTELSKKEKKDKQIKRIPNFDKKHHYIKH